jgi:hypothetical protein
LRTGCDDRSAHILIGDVIEQIERTVAQPATASSTG